MGAHHMGGIMVVFGTRPEAIKLSPVISAFRARGMQTSVCATGQHRELFDITLGKNGLRPDIELNLMNPGRSLAEMTADMLAALDVALSRERPDHVVVQ